MNKKIGTILICLIAVLSGISAQETVSAFGNLAVGVEVATTGFGLELATPLSPNFTLRGGFVAAPFKSTTTFSGIVDQGIIAKLDQAMDNPEVQSVLSEKGLPSRASYINNNIHATSSLRLANGKFLLEYYPQAKYSFHITAGAYFGPKEVIRVKGRMDEAVEVLTVLKDNGYDFFNEDYLVDESNGYRLSGKDLTDLRGELKTNTVKPYLGIGFGRSVPKSRVGVSFEIGAFYQGIPKLTSDNPNIQKLIDSELADISDVLKRIPVYPVISLKLNFNLF